MKLKLPAVYSQRDPLWASLFLGFNTVAPYTIGNYGCLITCLGMYVDKNPQQVNELVKSVNGFQQGGLFVWSSSPVLGITQTYLSPRYDGPVTSQGFTKLHELLDGGFPVLCEIDFNPNTQGEEMHYVLIYGYEGETYYAADPWTGTLIDLSVYGGPARAILQFRAYDKKLPQDVGTDIQAQLNQMREERDRNWNWFVAVCDALKTGANVDTAVAEATKLITIEQAVLEKDRQIADIQKQATDLQTQLSIKEQAIVEVSAQVATLTVAVGDAQTKINELTQQTKEDQIQLKELQEAAHITQGLTGFRKWLFDVFIKN